MEVRLDLSTQEKEKEEEGKQQLQQHQQQKEHQHQHQQQQEHEKQQEEGGNQIIIQIKTRKLFSKQTVHSGPVKSVDISTSFSDNLLFVLFFAFISFLNEGMR